ncbi:3-deoxy-manno-octulosonate cytidylyltransferase [Pseudomarimonas arenosa]|uniref:3-deoxy-manno-octulosonate cytidylyltransferase n=1 Tax=Pseudomarimonas arenosa TaxID=2774145 RepID=A0AAW3ZLI9_9GAMM|nr:3-deoxy-manno-octulosonate cytidylyltransferase [Pseudomarimonas arenosa]MBD8525281.1 3-deoxy-manno-octulosonate cytidylyltransferase [Pseudomarimonas arenosa]
MSTALDFVVAIPARYASSRLPGKPLASLAGRPMIAHVVDRALSAGAREVVVATDDQRVADAVAAQNIRVCMTAAGYNSGTDRLAECASMCSWEQDTVIVNLQGDEPLAPPAAIRGVAECLVQSGCEIATLGWPIESSEQLFDPNCVKLVRNDLGQALYFSRAPIPWHRDRFQLDRVNLPGEGWLRHIGMYAYRRATLDAFTRLPAAWLEQVEALEQLRALQAGWRVAVALSPVAVPAGVDTPEDLERVRRVLETKR